MNPTSVTRQKTPLLTRCRCRNRNRQASFDHDYDNDNDGSAVAAGHLIDLSEQPGTKP